MHSDFYVLFYFFKMYQWFCFITDFVFYFLQWLCINFRLKYWRKCSLNKYCIRWIPLTAVEYELISESAYIFTLCVLSLEASLCTSHSSFYFLCICITVQSDWKKSIWSRFHSLPVKCKDEVLESRVCLLI